MKLGQLEKDSPVDGVEADEDDGEGDSGVPLNVAVPDSTQGGGLGQVAHIRTVNCTGKQIHSYKSLKEN